jgi:hypothetical protein
MMIGLTRTLFTVALFAMLVAACGGPPSAPEEELRNWIAAGVEAAEDKERRELMSMISTSYTDARGNERSDIENLLRVYFLRQNRIVLLPNIEEITVYDDTAGKILLSVGMAGTNSGALGFSAYAYRFELEVERNTAHDVCEVGDV